MEHNQLFLIDRKLKLENNIKKICIITCQMYRETYWIDLAIFVTVKCINICLTHIHSYMSCTYLFLNKKDNFFFDNFNLITRCKTNQMIRRISTMHLFGLYYSFCIKYRQERIDILRLCFFNLNISVFNSISRMVYLTSVPWECKY